MIEWLKGLALLRHAELRRYLGMKQQHLLQVEQIRRSNAGIRVADDVVLVGYADDRLRLRSGVRIETGTVLSFGSEHEGYGRIEVGEGSWIGQYNNLRAGSGRIVIGRQCLISQFCTLVATNHDIRSRRPIQSLGPDPRESEIHIADDCWVGAGATVLPGVELRKGSVLAAGAVLTRSTGEYEIWAGIPAAKVGERTDVPL